MNHTYDRTCPRCPGEHGAAGPCDRARYSARRIRFILAHLEAYRAAFLDQHGEAARHELERLDREWRTLPPRHDCACWCPQERRGGPPCSECKRLRDAQPRQDIGAEIGHTSPVEPPTPDTSMLDLQRAFSLGLREPVAIARFLSGSEDE